MVPAYYRCRLFRRSKEKPCGFSTAKTRKIDYQNGWPFSGDLLLFFLNRTYSTNEVCLHTIG